MHLMNINSPLFSVQVLNTAHIQLLLYDEDLMPQKKCWKTDVSNNPLHVMWRVTVLVKFITKTTKIMFNDLDKSITWKIRLAT